MIMQSDLARLNTLSDELEDLYKPLRVDQYDAPINREEEREKVFTAYASGQQYNPQFIYRDAPSGWELPLKDFVRGLDPDANPWENLIYRDAIQMLSVLDYLRDHNPSQITAVSIARNGLPSRELVAQANQALQNLIAEPEEETVSAEQAAQLMTEALYKMNLRGWQVIVEEVMNAAMSVRSVEKQIKIRKGKKFSSHAVRRLLIHEIGTHVFRYTNGLSQPLRLLRLGLMNYIMTEEGMATFHENQYNLRDTVTARRYALRVIAAHLSLTHSFFDVFVQLATHTTLDDAFAIVVRAKRGFKDTAEYGAHVKDKVYFEGYQKVTEHLEAYTDDYNLLMSGKVSLDMIPALRELYDAELMTQPIHLPCMVLE